MLSFLSSWPVYLRNFCKLLRLYVFGFIDLSPVNHHLLVDNEGVENNALFTNQDFEIVQGLEQTVIAQEFSGYFPYFLKDAPNEPIKRSSSKKFKLLDFSIDKLKLSRKFATQNRFPRTKSTLQAPQSEITFASTESLIVWKTVTQNRFENKDQSKKHSFTNNEYLLRVTHVYSQKPERVNEPVGKKRTELRFWTVLTVSTSN